MLDRQNSFLMVVDVQERLVPALNGGELMAQRCASLLEAAVILDIPALITEQYPEGLGPTSKVIIDAAPETLVLAKNTFSAVEERSIQDHVTRNTALPNKPLVIAGCEAHVCVLQSAMDGIELGYKVAVVWDATASRFETDRDLAKARLVSAGAEIISLEMLLFEWLRSSKHPKFKAISSLVRHRTE